jgi:crossover junction endodeoxyribonuclease RuvC
LPTFLKDKQMSIILGGDLGLNRAIAAVDDIAGLIDIVDMPTLTNGPAGRRTINAPLLASIMSRWHAKIAYLEYVAARPGEGAVGAFSFGRSKGVVEGVCAALAIPVAFVTPPSWKRAVGIQPGKDGAKAAARGEAIRRWPAHAAMFARKKDDGRAEAALIALAGLMKERV